jgi:hypothetical protein
MLDWPRPPEGRLQEQINYLFDLLWKITEEINLLEEKLNDQSRD